MERVNLITGTLSVTASEAEASISEQELCMMVEDHGKDEISTQNLMNYGSSENTVEDNAEIFRLLSETGRQLITDEHPERIVSTSMIPDPSADTLSQVGLDKELLLFSDDSVSSFLDTEALNFDVDILYNALKSQSSITENSNESPLLISDGFKRDCNRCGKPEDLCSPECQLQEDYRHNPIVGNEQVLPADYQMVNPQHVLQVQHSYSPYNDHSYNDHPNFETKANDCYESELLMDDSDDEIIDVVTIQVEPPANKIPKRHGRKTRQKVKSSVAKSLAPNKRTGLKRKCKNHHQSQARECQMGRDESCEPSPLSSDAEDIGKRNNIKNMERKRRKEQKNCVQALRQVVPAV